MIKTPMITTARASLRISAPRTLRQIQALQQATDVPQPAHPQEYGVKLYSYADAIRDSQKTKSYMQMNKRVSDYYPATATIALQIAANTIANRDESRNDYTDNYDENDYTDNDAGYDDGYDEGYSDGYNDGHDAGYNDGYNDGRVAGCCDRCGFI